MKKNVYLLIIGTFFIYGCSSILRSKYRFNQPFRFSTKMEYLNYLENKYSFSYAHVLYPDSLSQYAFFNNVMQARLSQYYGTFINDTLEVKKTKHLSENLTCIGRVLKEIEINSSKVGYINDVTTNTVFRDYHFKVADNDSDFVFNPNGKVKIFLLYAFAMGNYFDEFFKDVVVWAKNVPEKVEIFIISLDPIQKLP